MPRRLPSQHEEGEYAERPHRHVEVIDDVVEVALEVLPRRLHDDMLAAQLFRHQLGVVQLVVFGAVGEVYREGDLGPGEAGDERRVDAAGQVQAEGHVGAQLHADGVREQGFQLVYGFGGVDVVEVIDELPVLGDAPAAEVAAQTADDQLVARAQRVDVAEERLLAGQVLEGLELVRDVDLWQRDLREQRLDLRGKEERRAVFVEIERLLTGDVAGQEQEVVLEVGQRECKHAVQAVQAGLAPLEIRV